MGFGTEILFVLMLGLLLLGPKRLHTLLAEAARAKARFEKASCGFKSQLMAELETASQGLADKRETEINSQVVDDPLADR